jgi:hypothetical protein
MGARGQIALRRVLVGMPRVPLALVSALALAGCGVLESPDLATGELTGRLVNATAAAYVYPLGRPDLAVSPAVDGGYTIARVPVETGWLVAVDGDGLAGSWRAELVPVEVRSGERAQAPERDALAMAAAGRVAAVARLGGGCESSALRFSVIGTDQVDVAPGAVGSAAFLEKLPPGTFLLAGRSGGFVAGSAAIEVRSGETVPYEIELEVEHETEEPGCNAEGASCRSPLVCDPVSGDCHECMSDADCAAPETSCVGHVCRLPASAGETCDPCSVDAECEPTTSGPAAVCASDAFCTHLCTGDAECPAGFACQLEPDGSRRVCRAPKGCEEARDEFGGECFFDSGCTDDLAGGVCHGEDLAAEEPLPGYCTGRCSRPDDCDLVPGFVCDTTPGVGLCVRG